MKIGNKNTGKQKQLSVCVYVSVAKKAISGIDVNTAIVFSTPIDDI